MVRALVLNATYEPLSVVPGRRAVVLVLADRADPLDGSGEWLHAERLALEVPSVIRLRTVVRVDRQREVAVSRRGVFARDAHRCQYCGERAETIVVFDAREAPPGLPRQVQHDGLSVHFAPRGSDADEAIELLIKENTAPRREFSPSI